MELNIPLKNNKKLEKVLEKVRNNVELQTYLKCSNVMAVDRLGYNDHGPVHVAIVTNISLKLLRNLIKAKVVPSIIKDYKDHKFTNEDAEVIVFLASMLHDVGHIVAREKHHQFSISLAQELLKDILTGIYSGEEKYIMLSDILNAIMAHDKHSEVSTVEGGVLRIADALDMEEGRARVPFRSGEINIHSVSAMAIDDVKINYKEEKPISIEIVMKNSAAIFQIDALLKNKIKGSKLENFVEVKASIKEGKEEKIIDGVKLF
jgi:uncharacterized protein